MATIKRKKVKVKGQAGANAKALLHNKRFWIIFSSVVGGIIAIGLLIWLIVYLCTDDENEIQDYFGGEATTLSYEYEGKDVKFHKASYNGVLMHHDVNDPDTFDDYIFVFATDLSTFYADKAIDDGKDQTDDDETFYYSETDNKVFNRLVQFQGEIDKYNANNEEGIKVQLYIVDTSISDNSSILADTLFGGSDDAENSAVFAMISEDGLVKEFTDTNKKVQSIYTNDVNEVQSSMVNHAITFMGLNFIDQKEKD